MQHITALVFNDFETLDLFGPVEILGSLKDMNASTTVYVTEYKGHLFKIRISQPNANYDRSIASLWDNFANRMFKFLRSES